MKDGPMWEKFNFTSPYVHRIDSAKPRSDTILVDKWFKVHKFWYETLTNNLYDECSSKYDTDFYNRNKSNLLEEIVQNDLGSYQKLHLKNGSSFLKSFKNVFYSFCVLIAFLS